MTTMSAWQVSVPAITLRQPWATLMALGAKRIETRDWAAPRALWGKDIAIHAAKVFQRAERELCLEDPFDEVLQRHGITRLDLLPLGYVLAIVTLVGAWPTESVMRWDRFPEYERDFGNYTPGRSAWVTKNVRPLEHPISATGKQGVWTWDPRKVSKEGP